eukprot:CAMPEP_0194288234 /NCGR_PEP_ID=MMETSP0169-20130528/36393_1 /TAXON_ID=218684 /ORGANISM="Corethron pennatum, Strain L29A3" /LENGTH=626 /DNA_ID=CAMNT_0039035173 /DNA_START=418 /DNA_END=2298 /DNA_ORIENTATION=-
MFTSAQHVATDLLLAVLLVGSFCIYFVNGSSFVIDDDRVKTLDISPALGRGYSVKTNQFHSICLDVDETTEPSYNYEYLYTDVNVALDVTSNTKVNAKVKSSFGWGRVKAEVETNAEVDTSVTVKKHVVMTTMRIDRYYASVMENKAPLSEDAGTLLAKKDYVGFYKACGPNYVRSIRRAQEVTAMFTFMSSDSTIITQMKTDIKATAYGARSVESSIDSSVNMNLSMSTLQIQIFGYGLGLDKDGSETLVATSLEGYNAAMNFAFSSMTRGNQGSAQTGMVYGIELVPWTDNTAFQVASNVHEIAKNNPAIWTVPTDMIPNEVDGTCEGVGHIPDDFLKCCKKNDMQKIGDDTTEVKTYCQPKRRFPVDLLKQNLQRNGEHVAMMDSILHHKTFTIMTLERCIQVLRSFPESEKTTYLETRYSVTDSDDDSHKTNNLVTVGDLKQFLNPKDDMASVDLLNMELDEYVDMYYNPCMAALFGMNADVVMNANAAGESDEPGEIFDYFMMKQWNSHPECAYASCVVPTNSWNNREGGCGPSFGQNPVPTLPVLEYCAKKFDSQEKEMVCKRSATKWSEKLEKLDGCWKNSTPFVLIERYCIPRLSERQRAEADNDGSKTIVDGCTPKK